jgi:DNA-binding beta-propeller fold protein YncE
VLVNNREPENRGAFFNAPGELVDALADPIRNRFYLLRQDTNQVLVYDAASYALVATLRTGNTPTQMAITFDRNYLLWPTTIRRSPTATT